MIEFNATQTAQSKINSSRKKALAKNKKGSFDLRQKSRIENCEIAAIQLQIEQQGVHDVEEYTKMTKRNLPKYTYKKHHSRLTELAFSS